MILPWMSKGKGGGDSSQPRSEMRTVTQGENTELFLAPAVAETALVLARLWEGRERSLLEEQRNQEAAQKDKQTSPWQ